MTEQQLIDYGFNKIQEDDFYYYEYDIAGLGFITQADDEVVDGEWHVYMFEFGDAFKFESIEDVADILRILRKVKVAKEGETA